MTRNRISDCLPERLHPFSRVILDYYLDGRIPTSEFARWFHMPNSSYLPASECIIAVVDPGWPERRRGLRG